MEAKEVQFPEGKRPEQSPVYAHNELFVPAPPERVWQWLIDANRWPDWYKNARDMHIERGESLGPGTAFDWITFGVRVHTKIEEHVPNRRLSWSGRGLGSTAYHGWVITPVAGGCKVVTEETQQGFIASLGRAFLKRGLKKWHQRWLEGLVTLASATA